MTSLDNVELETTDRTQNLSDNRFAKKDELVMPRIRSLIVGVASVCAWRERGGESYASLCKRERATKIFS